MYGGGALVILALLATVGALVRNDPRIDGTSFYTPGMTPTREDCVLSKMKSYAKIDRLAMQSIAMECELTVQSIEGHEKLRKEWEQRQAVRDATPKPATAEPTAPAEGDRNRRVWR
jgi:hypothetical protein